MNQMSLMAGALSSSSIDGGASNNDNNISNTGDGLGVGGSAGDGRRHINFDISDANNENDGTNNDPDQVRELATTTSTGSDYYAKGSAEVATESALTLAKIQHVSILIYCHLSTVDLTVKFLILLSTH